MAQVVYTVVSNIDQIAAATWHAGVQDSYAQTAKMADNLAGGPAPIRLIARRAHNGHISMVQAATGRGDWKNVNGFHFTLATELLARLEGAPEGDTLRPFIESLSPKAANAARQLIAVEDGPRNIAVLQVQAALGALGVPRGDWAFEPLMRAA
jgi:hypothetical protein